MSCISLGGTRCTKCCEAIHISKQDYMRGVRDIQRFVDQDHVLKYWIPISKRRAKKINPYLFSRDLTPDERVFLQGAQFFTCKALVKGVGCSIRNTDEHPEVCKIYMGGDEYSPTCGTDINIIARG